MTPLDQTLVDQMKKALSNSAPDVQWIVKTEEYDLDGRVMAEVTNGRVYLNDPVYPDAYTEITPKAFTALVKLAEKLGWQCD